ncbi:MAG TPA: hypothetical protein PLV21_03995 [Cyclobacteriaceae bacterium]|nr:hypothetical protein [Cyclobacteriaceae bacterium]HRJ81022.1 hypothetical protein [Cyclobacteriaceae bacterium]
MPRKIAVDIVVFLYILLLVYAALTKLLDYQEFSVQLSQSPILTNFSVHLAWGVPTLELVIAFSLMFSKTRLAGLYASFSLMTAFTMYIILASRFSDYVPCSCGGVIQNLSWSQHLVFNGSFLLLITGATLLYTKSEYPQGHTHQESAAL